MAEIRAIFGDDDRENEEFLGYDLDNIEEAEERYIQQIDALNDFDRPTLTFLIQKEKKDRQNPEIRLHFRVCFRLQQ